MKFHSKLLVTYCEAHAGNIRTAVLVLGRIKSVRSVGSSFVLGILSKFAAPLNGPFGYVKKLKNAKLS